MKQKHSVFLQGILLTACLSAAQVRAEFFSPGFLKLEVWTTGCTGFSIDELRACTNYPANPDEVHYLSRFEIPSGKYISGNSGGTAEGQKVSGFIVPAVSTNYIFYLNANYSGELWLSTDDTATNLQLIAQANHNVVPRTYNPNGASAPIPLVAGQRYYVEALQKSSPEDSSHGQCEENMAVTWTFDTEPSPQSGANPLSGQILGILTLSDTTPPSAVTNLAIVPNTAGGSYLHVNWAAPADPGNTNPVACYDLRYSTQPITSNNWASATPVDIPFVFGLPAGGMHYLRVNSLTPSTTYYLAIRSTDPAGNVSELSNVAQGKTATITTGVNYLWELEFPVAGADPTVYGDWINRSGALPATTWAAIVTNGSLTTPAWSPILDTRPYDNFTNPWVVEAVCKCVDTVKDSDVNGWSGADFFCNMDTRADGYYSQFAFGLALLADGTQTLGFNIDGQYQDQHFDGLSADFHDIRVEVDTSNQQYTVFIDSTNMGTSAYTRNSNGSGNGNTAPYATILGWNYTVQWKSVKIGMLVAPPPPSLQITKTGSSLAISWPATATGYTLQTTTSLSAANWTKAGDPAVQGGMNVFTTTASGASQFYRLIK